MAPSLLLMLLGLLPRAFPLLGKCPRGCTGQQNEGHGGHRAEPDLGLAGDVGKERPPGPFQPSLRRLMETASPRDPFQRCPVGKAPRQGRLLRAHGAVDAQQSCHRRCLSFPRCSDLFLIDLMPPRRFPSQTDLLTAELCRTVWCWGCACSQALLDGPCFWQMAFVGGC